MPAKISTHVFKGMQKDINVANSSNEYLFDAHNIRFNQLDDNTLMSIVNERGNECILGSGIEGQYVSHYVIGNHIVVFTYDETNELNIIYRIDVDEPVVTVHTLFDESDLNIRPAKPLEFTSYFEAEGVIKIYWVDGVNQLRFMNIMVDEPYTDPNDFNTTPELQLNETVTVEQIDGNGQFPAGVIQYALTYVNKLGAESNIFYTTKLHSIQYKNRAAGPQEYVNCAFKITISDVDDSFDYIRCYQLIRTSLDAQPTCLILNEVPTSNTVTIIDTNVGSTYDATALLFQKYPIKPSTLDQKSNTLFLGDINEEVFEFTEKDISSIRGYFNKVVEGIPVLQFANSQNESYELNDNNGYTFNANADVVRTFKSREVYRIGVQLQNIYGCWSQPVYLKDIEVDCKQLQTDNIISPIALIFDILNAGDFPQLNEEYKKFRFLMVNPTANDRSTFAQGIVIPTMYELSDRCYNAPHSYNSWFIRPFNSGITVNNNNIVQSRREYLAELQADKIFNFAGDWYTVEPTYNAGQGSTGGTDEFPNIPATISITLAFYRIEQMWVQVEMNARISKNGMILNYTPIQNQYVTRLPISANDNTRYLTSAEIDLLTINVMSLFEGGGALYQYVLNNDDHDRHGSRSTENNYIYASFHQKLTEANVILPAYGGGNTPNAYVMKFRAHNGIDLTDYGTGGLVPIPIENAGSLTDFRIDHSVLNLYSPDIDNNYYIIDNNKLQLDLIGYSPINNLLSNEYIELTNSGAGVHSHINNTTNYHRFGYNNYSPSLTKFLFNDTVVVKKEKENGEYETLFNQVKYVGQDEDFYCSYAVYPWHRAGSLNNDDNTNGETRSATYRRKVLAYQWISHITNYFPTVYQYKKTGNNTEQYSGNECGILKVCNETTSTKLFNQNGKTFSYIANVDIARTFVDNEYLILINKRQPFDPVGNITNEPPIATIKDSDAEIIKNSQDPIQIKYKSATHVLIPVEYKVTTEYDGTEMYDSYSIHALPVLGTPPTMEVPTSSTYPIDPLWYYPLWHNMQKYTQHYKNIKDLNNQNIVCDSTYLYIGELYRDIVNRYGGTIYIDSDTDRYDQNDSVLINNVFIPITEPISISSLSSLRTIETTYGDTWYGRWDCLKTQEMTDQDQQSIHDYASVMIESHINLNGRYDSYRNFYDQTLVNAQNANKFNDVYNQMDNFWSYKVIPNYLKTTYYPNQITWSLTKQSGALVDEWTRVTAANVEQLDGNKGPINKILNYKDSLFVFQDKCISQIKYNEQTQMTTTEGVSVEISNSQKVTGVVKVYDGTGCVNKWSIASDANGIFFVDNVNECIMWLGGSQDTPIVNLTNSKAFTQFMKANNSFDVWNPKDFSNFVTFIDSAHKDVYFVNNNTCLCFSLVLQEFTSFYDYQGTYGMFNINNNFYSLYDKNGLKLYRNFTGKYNEIYGELVDTSFTFIDHGESFLTDKTFTNINYIQDAYDVGKVDGLITQGERFKDDYDSVDYSYEKDITFQHLRVWTPFQDTGDTELKHNEDLQRKFRTWGIQISRDLKYNNTSVDRIRNNWAKFKFTFTQPDENKDIKIELMNINIQSIE